MRAFQNICVLVAALLLMNVLLPASENLAVPGQVQFAGRIEGMNLTAEGAEATEVKAGVRGVTFSLFAEQSGGAALWVESQNVSVSGDGAYSTLLGAETQGGIPQSIFSDSGASGAARWLEVSYIGADGVQVTQPRVLLVSVPYALKAGDAATLGGLPVSAFVLNADAVASRVSDNGGLPGATVTDVLPTAAVTAGRIAKFNSALATDVVDSIITEASGKIGIGTTTPVGTIDVGGWASIPGDIQGVGSTISGDVFMGNTNGGIGRFRMASNALQGFFSWNQYYNGTNHKGMDATAPGWRVNIGGTGAEDAYYVERSPATAGGHVPARLFVVNGNGNVGINTGGIAPISTLDVGGWPDKPVDIVGVGSTISGDAFMGNVGGNAGRYRMASNGNQGFFSWNQYYNGTVHKGMDATAPGWRINVGGKGVEDAFYVERSPATAGTHVPARLFQVSGSGNVGIGTIAPTAPLHVVGNTLTTGTATVGGFTMNVGSSLAGKVLTSDANGVASWQTPAGGGGGISGTGTANKLTKFTGATAVGDSQITDNGTDVTISVNGGGLAVLANATGPNMRGGFSGNSITSGVAGGTISGGGGESALGNRVTDNFGTVAGGTNNQAGDNDANLFNKSYSTVSGGRSNLASGAGAVIAGGLESSATGDYSTVGGGLQHTVSGLRSVIAGGHLNSVSGANASIGGGSSNAASASGATIGGGLSNVVSAPEGTVSGGTTNKVFDRNGTIGGGQANEVGDNLGTVDDRDHATVAGGLSNTASGAKSVVAGGSVNTASGLHAAVVGGNGNTAINSHAFIGGGLSNSAGGQYATVGGGQSNDASGNHSTTAGGNDNTSSGANSVVAGGLANLASGSNSFVGAGNTNVASGGNSVVAGGLNNLANASGAFVGAGQLNTATATWSSAVGGSGNDATANYTIAGGGLSNAASNTYAAVLGGLDNLASGVGAAVGGGSENVASGSNSAVPGGSGNSAAGSNSLAVGAHAKASHHHTFVWNDTTVTDLISTAERQFLINAANGVGIGTNAPNSQLHIVGGENTGTTAGLQITSGTQNIFLDGNEIDSNSSGGLFLNNNVNFPVILAAGGGSVGIDNTTPADKLQVNGDIRIGLAGSNIGCVKDENGTLLTGACSSDVRFKKNITPFAAALSKVAALRPVHFDWRVEEFPAKRFGTPRSYGLIAQEVEQVLPELVNEDSDGYKVVNYSQLPLYAIQAIKELEAENQVLRAELASQKAETSTAMKNQQAEISELREMLMSLQRQLGTQLSKAVVSGQ